jgi:anaerobic selenocysteine-containing dehydrogenase
VVVESRNGALVVQARLMQGVNPDTVWTWNAIGKRAGAWTLDRKAPEAERGFLLNHIISEYLPPDRHGHRASNSDPVTGQAAWFDLKVRVRKASPEEAGRTSPHPTPIRPPFPVQNPELLRYGAIWEGG